MSLVEQERAKYLKVWAHPDYRVACHSLRLWEERPDLFKGHIESALDIGCGLGRLIPVLVSGAVDAWGVDFAVPECLDPEVARLYGHRFSNQVLWEMEWNRTFDLGICTDVLEHLPEEKVEESLERIAACCRRVIFKVAHNEHVWLGEQLHMTIRPVDWWQDAMTAIAGEALAHGTMLRSGYSDSLIEWRTGL